MNNLTPRQAALTALAAQGLSSKKIAAIAGIAESTSRVTLQQARERIGAKSVAHLVAIAISRGWIAPLLLAITVSAISPDVHLQRPRSGGTRYSISLTKLSRRQESSDIAGLCA
jgi:DNA-binding CsgD family transcriptional regulator